MDGELQSEKIYMVGSPMIQDFQHFTIGSKKVDLVEILKEFGKQLFPYCVDIESETVVLVKIEGSLKEYGTFYTGINKTMKQVYAIPLKEIEDLMGQNFDFSPILFVYKAGRCGSILMTSLMDKTVGGCEGYSEPIVFTQLAHLFSDRKLDDKSSAYLRAVVWVFVQGARKRLFTNTQHPPLVVLCPQGIGKIVYVLHQKAIPQAKAIFLYRNPLQILDSFYSAVAKIAPHLKYLRMLPFLQAFVGLPAFYYQPNYLKSTMVHANEFKRQVICFCELFLEQLVKPNQSIFDYAVKEYYYNFIGVGTMGVYGALYTIHDMYNKGLVQCSLLYENYIGNVKNTFVKLGDILDMKEFFNEDNIDEQKIKEVCGKNVHDYIKSGRNEDYNNYDHFEGNRVQYLTKNEIQWQKRAFQQFKQLTGLEDYIIDGTIYVEREKLN
eukprot:TRINITY_DN1259_c2_g1_i2.p1 TRINITY_DN1259_c2_g1~~TRINITY_DN1259_c2_g1_i2.p1  ORF type:complete len:502 (-),score=18.29 TRINITY_DN1259_c2_g1_i2:45-1355(-)